MAGLPVLTGKYRKEAMPGRSLRRRVDHHVPREECERRVLAALDKVRPMYTATVADHIWPGHEMKPQAAALAAGAILGRMQHRGLVGRYKGGWVRT